MLGNDFLTSMFSLSFTLTGSNCVILHSVGLAIAGEAKKVSLKSCLNVMDFLTLTLIYLF